MYIINVVARVCSSPLPAPCPRNKARVIPDATKLIPPPPHSLFDQITGNSHLNDGSSPGQRIGNLESLMQDPDGQERKLWPTTQGLWSFPTAASSPPPHPSPLPFGTYFHMPINQMLNWRDMLTNRIRYLLVNLTLAPPPSLQSRGELQPNLLFNM